MNLDDAKIGPKILQSYTYLQLLSKLLNFSVPKLIQIVEIILKNVVTRLK